MVNILIGHNYGESVYIDTTIKRDGNTNLLTIENCQGGQNTFLYSLALSFANQKKRVIFFDGYGAIESGNTSSNIIEVKKNTKQAFFLFKTHDCKYTTISEDYIEDNKLGPIYSIVSNANRLRENIMNTTGFDYSIELIERIVCDTYRIANIKQEDIHSWSNPKATLEEHTAALLEAILFLKGIREEDEKKEYIEKRFSQYLIEHEYYLNNTAITDIKNILRYIHNKTIIYTSTKGETIEYYFDNIISKKDFFDVVAIGSLSVDSKRSVLNSILDKLIYKRTFGDDTSPVKTLVIINTSFWIGTEIEKKVQKLNNLSTKFIFNLSSDDCIVGKYTRPRDEVIDNNNLNCESVYFISQKKCKDTDCFTINTLFGIREGDVAYTESSGKNIVKIKDGKYYKCVTNLIKEKKSTNIDNINQNLLIYGENSICSKVIQYQSEKNAPESFLRITNNKEEVNSNQTVNDDLLEDTAIKLASLMEQNRIAFSYKELGIKGISDTSLLNIPLTKTIHYVNVLSAIAVKLINERKHGDVGIDTKLYLYLEDFNLDGLDLNMHKNEYLELFRLMEEANRYEIYFVLSVTSSCYGIYESKLYSKYGVKPYSQFFSTKVLFEEPCKITRELLSEIYESDIDENDSRFIAKDDYNYILVDNLITSRGTLEQSHIKGGK